MKSMPTFIVHVLTSSHAIGDAGGGSALKVAPAGHMSLSRHCGPHGEPSHGQHSLQSSSQPESVRSGAAEVSVDVTSRQKPSLDEQHRLPTPHEEHDVPSHPPPGGV